MPKPLLIALFVFAALPLAACGDGADQGQVDVNDLRLVRQPGGLPIVSGVFVNGTEKQILSADVGVQLYDAKNLPYDEPARLVVRNIPALDSVRFRHRIDVDARGARLKYIHSN